MTNNKIDVIKLTSQEIVEELTQAGIRTTTRMRKSELLTLLDGKRRMEEMKEEVLQKEIAKAKALEELPPIPVDIPYGIENKPLPTDGLSVDKPLPLPTDLPPPNGIHLLTTDGLAIDKHPSPTDGLSIDKPPFPSALQDFKGLFVSYKDSDGSSLFDVGSVVAFCLFSLVVGVMIGGSWL